MNILEDFKARGLFHQCTDEEKLISRLAQGPITVYAGFDPTSESLQLGNLVALISLLRFYKAGHSVIPILGGATGMIGDPSGKSEERQLLDSKILKININAIDSQLQELVDRQSELTRAISIFNNLSWHNNYPHLLFFKEIGKYFSINEMIRKDSVKSRLENREQGISYTEFSYMLLQAYDFLYLNTYHNCELQIGGSDQWGNITAGIDLIRKKTQKQSFGLTIPLLTDSFGNKFGKSEKGAIYLSAKKTSPFHFYQFLLNVSDIDAIRYLKILTFLSTDEISAIEERTKTKPEEREAQIKLADEVTTFVHGSLEVSKIKKANQILFKSDLNEATEEDFKYISNLVPFKELVASFPMDILSLLKDAEIVSSNGEGKRLIASQAIYLNSQKLIGHIQYQGNTLLFGKYLLIRKGKKDFTLIRFRSE